MSEKLTAELARILKFSLDTQWLRPESVMFAYFKIKSMRSVDFESPSLELACGDGTTMFAAMGGEFEFDYDVYVDTHAAAFKHEKFVDIFDHDTGYQPPIKTRPIHKIDHAIDWKPALLQKAERLDLYENTSVHDMNELPLPFEDETFKVVFSNSLYWMENVVPVMTDIRRILKPGGRMVVQLTTSEFLSTLDKLEPTLSSDAINILDRSRRATMPSGRPTSEWESLVKGLGYEIERIESVFPAQFLMDFWNVGSRPFAHLLIQMLEELSPERRREIKKEWIKILGTLMEPLANLPQTCPVEKAPYILLVARK